MNPERLTEIRARVARIPADGYGHVPVTMLCDAVAALDEATARADVHEYTLNDLRRQMEELRERGNWPVAKVVAEREAAEAQARTLADALEQIEKYYATWWSPGDREFQAVVVARAALDEYKAKP